MSRDVYQEVTDSILGALDQGIVPWRRPWQVQGGHRNLQSGRPYRGINQFLTAVRAIDRGYASPHWTTFRAAKKAGGAVRKGERGTLVTFWKRLKVKDAEAENGYRIVFMLRHYTVFNLDQVDGLEAPAEPERRTVDPIEAGELLIAGMPNPPKIVHGGDRAFYRPQVDGIQLPERDDFFTPHGYYATAFHELAHSTGHQSRLNRPEIADGTHKFGSADYSREELVAELGASMLCGTSGIDPDIPQAASYIDGWRKVLGQDKKLIVQAAGKAQRAADYILGVKFEETS
jgi:antirestriction protein ArdC